MHSPQLSPLQIWDFVLHVPVGDEIYFLIKCQSLSIIREKLFAEGKKNIPHFISLTC